jgi:hypothetical protein
MWEKKRLVHAKQKLVTSSFFVEKRMMVGAFQLGVPGLLVNYAT